jgi:Asp-tRNA(Asn)/Glu-tRNA(Gln) amidotransferase A subunit family amidase
MFETIKFAKFTMFMDKMSIPSVAIPTPIKHPDGMPAGIIIFGKPG